MTAPSATFSLRLPQETIQQLGLLAEATGKSRNAIASQAMQEFITREAWQVQRVLEAVQEADAGNFADEQDVHALDKKWGYTKNSR